MSDAEFQMRHGESPRSPQKSRRWRSWQGRHLNMKYKSANSMENVLDVVFVVCLCLGQVPLLRACVLVKVLWVPCLRYLRLTVVLSISAVLDTKEL
jgi:hypothetical protein